MIDPDSIDDILDEIIDKEDEELNAHFVEPEEHPCPRNAVDHRVTDGDPDEQEFDYVLF